ncbi:outer membrane beta-barrel protein, partial [Escherichia coli]
HRFTAGASIERDFGKLRGLAALDLSRTVYTDAKGLNGQPISLSDRDQKAANLRGRIGYELSPALIPFLELNAGTTKYDRRLDNS